MPTLWITPGFITFLAILALLAILAAVIDAFDL